MPLLPAPLPPRSAVVGTQRDGSTLLPTGQTIRPAGECVTFHGRPIDLVLAPDGSALYVKDDRGLVVVDAIRWKVRQQLPFPAGGGSLHGIAVSRDGKRVYATNATDRLFEASVDADGTLTWGRQIPLAGPKGQGASFPCGLALTADGSRAYIALSINNTLGVVDLNKGLLIREIPVGMAPWGVTLSPNEETVMVSDWGGQPPHAGDLTALSAGSPTRVDRRGVASSGTVSFVNLTELREGAPGGDGRQQGKAHKAERVETGLHPCDLRLSPDGRTLYVANANSDTLSVVDVTRHRVVQTISTHPGRETRFGSAPDALVVSRDGRTLYVANANDNHIVAYPIGPNGTIRSSGLKTAPTAWYPGALALDSKYLYIADVKGFGSRDPDRKASGWNAYDFQGAVQRVELKDFQRLNEVSGKRVNRHSASPLSAASKAEPLPRLQHVVYVIKENRTYDQVFGDLKQGNGDPSLVLFGREVTPNHHALAEEFVLLDNFYCNGVLSADGHSWVTEGNSTDHLEKAFGGFTRSYTFGDDPLTYSSSGFVWDNVLDHGLTVRNYGEMDYATPSPAGDWSAVYRDHKEGRGRFRFRHNIGIARLRSVSSTDYPGWNLGIPDAIRADLFLRDLKRDSQRGNWPSLVILYLPNDHTSGTAPGTPTPRAQVADNDLALGRVVEGISHSPFWPQTCIFVVEDDAQNGRDHVDGHRSPALVISPFTRRGAVVSRFYNQTSVLHTLERLLGLPAMNRMDGLSPTMDACFTAKPDLQPYRARPNQIPLDEMNPPLKALHGPALRWARLSAHLPFDGPDEADSRTLNRILEEAPRGRTVARRR